MQNYKQLIQKMVQRGVVQFSPAPKAITTAIPGFTLPPPPGKRIKHPKANERGKARYLKRVGRKTYTSHPELRGWPRKKYMKLYNAQRYQQIKAGLLAKTRRQP